MSYQSINAGAPAELTCSYGASKLRFRGPERSLDQPYVACIGGEDTFGRFVDNPFPAVLQQRLDRPCINFGSLFCGAEALLQDDELVHLANAAEICVLQLPGLTGHSNRFYRVHPRRNDRFVAPTPELVALYPEVDFTEIHFVRHLLSRLQGRQDARFQSVVEELRQSWLCNLRSFLQQITSPIVLLALEVEIGELGQTDPSGPPIQASMLAGLEPLVSRIIDIRVPIAGASDELEDILFGTLQQPIAEHMIGPAAHRHIAECLSSAIRDLED